MKMKPNQVTNCRRFGTCDSGKISCVGCNIWNYLYDENALISWCEKQHQDVALFTINMQQEVNK
jgi:hypothetical protein